MNTPEVSDVEAFAKEFTESKESMIIVNTGKGIRVVASTELSLDRALHLLKVAFSVISREERKHG